MAVKNLARVIVKFSAPFMLTLRVQTPDGDERIVLVDPSIPLWYDILYRLVMEYGVPHSKIDDITWVYEMPDDVLETILKLAEMKDWFLEYLAHRIPLKTLKKLVDEAYKVYLAEKAVTT